MSCTCCDGCFVHESLVALIVMTPSIRGSLVVSFVMSSQINVLLNRNWNRKKYSPGTGSGSLYLRGSVCRCVCKSRSSSAAWSRPSPRAQSKRLML